MDTSTATGSGGEDEKSIDARTRTTAPLLLLSSTLLLLPDASAGDQPPSPSPDPVSVAALRSAEEPPAIPDGPPEYPPFGSTRAVETPEASASPTPVAPRSWALLQTGLAVFGVLALVSWFTSLAWAVAMIRRNEGEG